MRLIDADEVLKIVKHFGLSNPALIGRHSGIADIIYDRIEGLDIIEAEPVRHGKWIDMGDFVQCSQCRVTRMKEFHSLYGKVESVPFSKYCPSCGAKMDGGNE